jgi:hypothetical protein
MKRKDWSGTQRTLVSKDNGVEYNEGDEVVSFRGETYTLRGGDAPHKPESQGKVYVTRDGGGPQTFYPSVFELVWR